jgi:hypothetical protein
MWGAGVYLSEHNVLTVILVIFDIGSVPTMWSSFFDLFQQCGLPSLFLMLFFLLNVVLDFINCNTHTCYLKCLHKPFFHF